MRWLIVGTLILFLIVPMTIFAGEYKPLSREEAEDWLKSITYDELLDFVIKYDFVEHAKPEVDPPERVYLIEKRDLHVVETEPMQITIGHLEYEIHQEDEEYKKFVPRSGKGKTLLYAGAGGLIIGFLVGGLFL